VSGKAERVQTIFSTIAPRYDLVNDVMTFGQARAWRNKLVRLSGAREGMSVLDVATGTGDLAIVFKKVTGPSGPVTGVDFCAGMLDFAPAKAQSKNLEVTFKLGDAMALDFADSTFDVVSIAYGIRNVTDAAKSIREMARVIKPGGKFMVLETGRSTWPVYGQAVDFYCAKIMPVMGGFLSGSKDAYKYLDASSKDFPYGAKFVEMLKKEGGFGSVIAHPLMGGVSYIYECTKPQQLS